MYLIFYKIHILYYKRIEYEHHVLTIIYRTSPHSLCFLYNVKFREYFVKNEISYTADYSNEIWAELCSFLRQICKFIKDIELSSYLCQFMKLM